MMGFPNLWNVVGLLMGPLMLWFSGCPPMMVFSWWDKSISVCNDAPEKNDQHIDWFLLCNDAPEKNDQHIEWFLPPFIADCCPCQSTMVFTHVCLPHLMFNAQILLTIACQDPASDIFSSSTCQKLRALDSELRAHIKGNDPNFDLSKLAFYAEATGSVQENHILDAQNAVNNARKSSLQAAWNLFRTSVENDQVVHERYLQAAKTDEARARSSALTSLEVGGYVCWLFHVVSFYFVSASTSLSDSSIPWQKMHSTAWGLVQSFATETVPTWNAASKKGQGVAFWLLARNEIYYKTTYIIIHNCNPL